MVRVSVRCKFATEERPWNKFNSDYNFSNSFKFHASQVAYRPKCVLKFCKIRRCSLNLEKRIAELAVKNKTFLTELLFVSFVQRNSRYYSLKVISSTIEPSFSRHDKKILKVVFRPIKIKVFNTFAKIKHHGYVKCGDRFIPCKLHPDKMFFSQNTFFLTKIFP